MERKSQGTRRATLVSQDPFAREVVSDMSRNIKRIADNWAPTALSAEEVLDYLLLVLHDALFLQQSDEWTREGKANLRADDTLDLAHWFLKGQSAGAKPMFDGICAFCGSWLRGDQNQHTASSNKRTGPPVDADGNFLPVVDGKAQLDKQPPFLLRYGPQLFAKEAPSISSYCDKSNTLKLQPGVGQEPWIRPKHSGYTESVKVWLYCIDCDNHLFHNKPRLPFRDRASQCMMKPQRRRQPLPQGQPSRATTSVDVQGSDQASKYRLIFNKSPY